MLLSIMAVLLFGSISCDSNSEDSIDGNYIYQTDFALYIQDPKKKDLGNDIEVKEIHVPEAEIPAKSHCLYDQRDGCFYVTFENLLFTPIEGTFFYDDRLYENLREAVTEIDIEWMNGDIDHVKTTHLSSGAMCLISKIWINGELVHDKTSSSLNGKIVLIKEP